jgi:FKBP-type peptidyl-prolyl cis-trans isomerase
VKLFASIAVLCFFFAIGGCGGDDSSAPLKSETAEARQESAKPKVQVPSAPPPKKLLVEDSEVGSGPTAKAGDEVTVHYVGVEYKNGKQIDASWDRGEPFSFQLGGGTVIKGWEQGVPGMKVGGRRQLIIPSNLAYGSGALIFVIDLVAIGPQETTRAKEEPEIRVPNGPPPTKVVINELREGSGEEVKAGDEILVDYVGVNYRTGEKFESTWAGNDPSSFTLGTGEVIKGWDVGLKGMKVGGRRELIIPSSLAYKTGTLIYVIDLVEIE